MDVFQYNDIERINDFDEYASQVKDSDIQFRLEVLGIKIKR
jgi:hypothetical protein